MDNLLKKINDTFDNCIANSSEETQLQLKIIKNNINTLFNEYSNAEINSVEKTEAIIPAVDSASPSGNSLTHSVIEENYVEKSSILIVDDSSIVRNYLEKIFFEEYNVLLAVDGQEAIEKLSNEEFTKKINLILLDLMMPNIDGFGVLEYLNGKKINIPIMIISGDNSKDTINRAFQYNVVDVIEKPFDTKTIKDKISRFTNL